MSGEARGHTEAAGVGDSNCGLERAVVPRARVTRINRRDFIVRDGYRGGIEPEGRRISTLDIKGWCAVKYLPACQVLVVSLHG